MTEPTFVFNGHTMNKLRNLVTMTKLFQTDSKKCQTLFRSKEICCGNFLKAHFLREENFS